MPNDGRGCPTFSRRRLDELLHIAAAIIVGGEGSHASRFDAFGAVNLNDAFESHAGAVSLLLHLCPAKDFLHQFCRMWPDSLRPLQSALLVHSQVRFVIFRHMRQLCRILPNSSLQAGVTADADAVLIDFNQAPSNPDCYFLPRVGMRCAVKLFQHLDMVIGVHGSHVPVCVFVGNEW